MEVSVQNLNGKMREIIADRERSNRGRFSANEKRVSKSIGSVERAAVNLDEAVRRAWGTLSKPAEQHGVRLSEQVRESCRSLAAHPRNASYAELRKFQEESVQTVRSIVKTYNKYVPSIIRVVKSESSSLEDSIATLSQNVTELGQVLDSSNLKELRLIANDADDLVQTAHELSLKIDEIHQAKEAEKKLHAQESRLQSDLSSLSLDGNLKELGHIEEEARQKEAEVLALLEALEKPLRKMDRADGRSLEGPSRTLVGKMVEDPLRALVEIPAGDIRQLLDLCYRLLERDELLLDQRRKRRAIEAIEMLQTGALDRFKEDYEILEANRREVLRQLKGSGLYDQWLSARKQLDDIRIGITQHQNRIAELESQEARLRESVMAGKERIESALRKVTDEEVSILV